MLAIAVAARPDPDFRASATERVYTADIPVVRANPSVRCEANEQPRAPRTIRGITQLIDVVRSSGAVLAPITARLTMPKAVSMRAATASWRPVVRMRLRSQPNSATAPAVTNAMSQGLR